MVITSSSNARVKLIRALLQERRSREEAQQWCLEGVRLLEEALDAHLPLQFVLYAPARLTNPRAAALLTRLRAQQVVCEETHTQVLDAISGTTTSPGIMAVASWPQVRPFPAAGLLLVLDALSDPGNLGTILRTALAAGCAGVLLAPGSVDIYNPKVVRAAMGAHLYLPVRSVETWADMAAAVTGRQVWLADAHGDTLYDAVDWRLPTALIIGNEGAGASADARRLAVGTVTIPIAQAESLNAAVAAAVFCFESARQRRRSDHRRPPPG
ncbi:MAG: RNA methyltransferase [Anaerolineae bacterium]|uniref:TrmH family RNA methyltransferase n=1 Tax=Candidatus Amarolinea dominans TaxID=3140696 RepID=UPI0031371ACB|nr:RNA methyltransferase [Anaerolineae bacterium]